MARATRSRHVGHRAAITAVNALVLFTLASCADSDPLPDAFPGNIDGMKYLVPARKLTVPLRYAGEDDWHPPLKPWRDRTFADPIAMIEFDLTFDDLKRVPNQADADVRVMHDHDLRSPGVFGPWVGVTLATAGYSTTASNPAAMGNMLRMMMRQSLPDGTRYDLRAFKVVAAKRYPSDYSEGYLSIDGDTAILCNNNRQKPPPHIDRATCDVTAIDRQNHALLWASIDRVNLVQWREMLRAASSTVAHWRAGKVVRK